ncbi:hypothetical protein CN533_05040 [Priestia megaterium]|uniref:hypothetical protein n=1 Tax=Priestia megaterium TaxID=1404 RepID=UPI000BF465B4|nr:hypothetical protein [Priestia megaterium]PET72772.1 hypothetical protein CN533_05040 [Priestia megaterium]PFK88892.1 hypothetical protein COJ19_04330 [Priestia megaterium]
MSSPAIITLNPDEWKFRCSNYRFESTNGMYADVGENINYSLYVNNNEGNFSVPFIYYDIPHMIMAGTEIIFRATLCGESVCPERTVKLAIGINVNGTRQVSMTESLTIEKEWKTFELKHEKVMIPTTVRIGVYWYDSSPVNLILNGKNTVLLKYDL